MQGWVAIAIAAAIMILPLYGLLYLGIRRERLETKRLLRDSMRTLLIVGNTRGRR